MKALAWIIGIVAIAGWGLFQAVSGPVYTYRFRLTVEISTPEGAKSASSVIEVRVQDNTVLTLVPYEARKVLTELKGEAVFVDLGTGRNVIALLATGTTAQGTIQYIVRETLGRKPVEDYASYQMVTGIHEVPLSDQPTLVTFTDLTDPASARVLYATGRDVRLVPTSPGASTSFYKDFGPLVLDRFTETFGAGYAFKRATVEMTTDPISKGIEGKVAGLKNRDEWDKKVGEWANRTRATPASAANIPAVGSMSFIRNK